MTGKGRREDVERAELEEIIDVLTSGGVDSWAVPEGADVEALALAWSQVGDWRAVREWLLAGVTDPGSAFWLQRHEITPKDVETFTHWPDGHYTTLAEKLDNGDITVAQVLEFFGRA